MFSKTTVVIVTYKSEKVIFECLNGLKSLQKILILDNSYDEQLEATINNTYKNVKFYKSKINSGYSAGHNFLLNKVVTEYALLISPDVITCKEEIEKIFFLINKIGNNFALIGPKNNNFKGMNYGFYSNKFKKKYIYDSVYEAEYIYGFFMFMKLDAVKSIGFFDDNFFLYNEDLDLCLRLKKNKHKIFIVENLNVNHLSAKSSYIGEEYIKCKNWHWMWSKFYFYSKIYGYSRALFTYLPKLIVLFFKTILSFVFKRKKYIFFKMRFLGLLNSMLKKKSYYRPIL